MENPLVFLVAGILPYLSVLVFVGGVGGALWRWSRVRVPLKITLTPSPSNVVGDIASEALLFKTLLKGSKGLWAGGWLFHWALALCLIGHFFGIALLAHQFVVLGASERQSEQLSALLGGVVGIGLVVALLYLLYRRTTVAEVRALSDASDYLLLLLIASIALTGNYLRVLTQVDLATIRAYVGSLLTFSPAPPDNPLFLVHFFFVQLLLLYFPGSKLMHSCGLFFTRWLLGKRDLVSPGEVGA